MIHTEKMRAAPRERVCSLCSYRSIGKGQGKHSDEIKTCFICGATFRFSENRISIYADNGSGRDFNFYFCDRHREHGRIIARLTAHYSYRSRYDSIHRFRNYLISHANAELAIGVAKAAETKAKKAEVKKHSREVRHEEDREFGRRCAQSLRQRARDGRGALGTLGTDGEEKRLSDGSKIAELKLQLVSLMRIKPDKTVLEIPK